MLGVFSVPTAWPAHFGVQVSTSGCPGWTASGTWQFIQQAEACQAEHLILANPSRVVQGDRVTRLLYDLVGTTPKDA